MKLDDVLSEVTTTQVRNLQLVEVSGISCDSRDVQPGDVFVAMPGSRTNGVEFIDEALKKGAVAVITEDENVNVKDVPLLIAPDARQALAMASRKITGDPSGTSVKVVGVTGTSGKTTVTHLVKHVLDTTGRPAGLIGTIHNMVGDETIPAVNTTPLSADIQKMLAEMARHGQHHAVMEVSSHAIVEERILGVQFEVAAITNISPEHLDYHETFENYVEAKTMLFQKSPKSAVFNMDDEACRRISEMFRGPKSGFSISRGADFEAHDISLSQKKTSFVINAKGERVAFDVPLLGAFNVENVLAAAAIAGNLDVSLAETAEALKSFNPVRGRMEQIHAGQPFSVYVDYAHKPNALKKVLKLAADITPGRVLVVFGCGGDRDRKKRPVMGQIAEMYADLVFLTSDNPRSEHPEAILNEISQGITCLKKVERSADRKASIEAAIREAKEGDTVLIAGKGHETYQISGDQRRHFDDAETARQILAEMGWS